MRVPNSDWHDMSRYVVHFTKAYGMHDAYTNMTGIYSACAIKAENAFGVACRKAPDRNSQKVACFSEVPLHLLGRLVARRGPFGIGFEKRLLVKRGGGPVLYAYRGTPQLTAVYDLMDHALDLPTPENDPIWKVTPFIEAPGDYGGGKLYFFEWEREWRHVGSFNFSPEDVAFLVIPEALHVAARGFFETVRNEDLGPYYSCPFIDPYWDLKKLLKKLPTC